IYLFNLGKTLEKIEMAARVIAAIENPQDIIVQSARPYGQRAVLKFAQYTGAHAIAGRHTPGTFTNQLQTSFSEPRLLILTDPRTDHQPIKEAALGNIPTIAFCDTDSPMRYVDIGHKWEIPVDLFFYREPEEAKEPEEEDAAVADYNDYTAGAIGGWTDADAPVASADGWDAAPTPAVDVAAAASTWE
nr:40S ribosomal protein SA-like [Tanacetum cinerariifolium]